MKHWRRKGTRVPGALEVPGATELSLTAIGGEVLTADWLAPVSPSFWRVEIRYDGGAWTLVQDDISGEDRTVNIDAAGHLGELARARIAGRVGTSLSGWTESNDEAVTN
ncbi:MAG: hypothetical protein ACREXS_11195 [Gammaproteobacteria bacterium]